MSTCFYFTLRNFLCKLRLDLSLCISNKPLTFWFGDSKQGNFYMSQKRKIINVFCHREENSIQRKVLSQSKKVCCHSVLSYSANQAGNIPWILIFFVPEVLKSWFTICYCHLLLQHNITSITYRNVSFLGGFKGVEKIGFLQPPMSGIFLSKNTPKLQKAMFIKACTVFWKGL